MKYLKISGISVLQTLLFFLISWKAIHLSIQGLIPDGESAAAIGIIGGADGPTAIFVSTKVQEQSLYFILLMSVLLISFISNLSSQIKQKTLSALIFSLCCLITAIIAATFIGVYVHIGITLIVILLIFLLMFAGYLISRKV